MRLGAISLGSLRLRVVGAAALAIFLAVSALGITVAVTVASELRSSLDRSLHARALDVARLAVSAPALLTAPGALDAPAGGRQLTVEVLDRQGRIAARSSALGGRVLSAGHLLGSALRRGVEGYADGTLSGEAIRLHAVPIADAGGPVAGGAVLVSSSVADIDRTQDRLRSVIALAALAAAALGALAAALLTARGLAPLRRLSEAASAIARTGDASRRLPAPATHDELAELADTLNTMLGTLERARETERRFLADASHELRTPLTSLRGNLAYLRRHGSDQETLADLEAQAAQLGALVDDLLALEREGAAPPPDRAVALDDLVRRVADEHGAGVARCDPVRVQGDPDALERALRNLLENAVRHGPAGGAVTVELTARGASSWLSVRDEGPGPPAEERERVFDRFWRGSQAAGPGSGLGLALVREVAARHGGGVEVSGSRFTIVLPIVREPSDSGTTLDGVNPGGPST